MCKKIFFFVHNDSRECHNSHLNVMTLPRLNLSFRSRIGQVFFAGLLQNFMQIFGGFPACHSSRVEWLRELRLRIRQ